MSNRRYLIEVSPEDVSKSFHALLRQLELCGFRLARVGTGAFEGTAALQSGLGPLTAVIRGRVAGERYEIILDLLDPPDRHIPEGVCDATALWVAEQVARALQAKWGVRYLGPTAGAQALKAPRGEVRVVRSLCG